MLKHVIISVAKQEAIRYVRRKVAQKSSAKRRRYSSKKRCRR